MTQNMGNGKGNDLQRIVEQAPAAAPEADYNTNKKPTPDNDDHVTFGAMPPHMQQLQQRRTSYIGRPRYHR